MKSRIFMYVFVFVLLLVIFQYVNSKNIFETYQEKMTKQIEKEEQLKDSIKHLNQELKMLKNQLNME